MKKAAARPGGGAGAGGGGEEADEEEEERPKKSQKPEGRSQKPESDNKLEYVQQTVLLRRVFMFTIVLTFEKIVQAGAKFGMTKTTSLSSLCLFLLPALLRAAPPLLVHRFPVPLLPRRHG